MSLLLRKSAVPEIRLLAQKAKLPSLPQLNHQVAAFSTKSKRPPASNLRRRNGNRKPAPNSLSKSTSRDTSGFSFQQQQGTSGSASSIGPYGLRRIDYSVVPKKWTLPPHPPPRKNPVRRYFPLMVLGTGLTFLAFVVVYRDDDQMAEYWKQVDTGFVPMDGDDDDDDDDDDEIDADFDEWENVKKPERS
jgi:hypothetical protein